MDLLPFDTWPSGILQADVPANNNALRSQVLAGYVISKVTAAQPGSPTEGDIYIIPAAATGDQWSTFTEDDLAIYSSGTWYSFTPPAGIIKNVAGTLEEYSGSAWGAVNEANLVWIGIACSDETSALTTGAAKATFRMPHAMTLTAVRASVTTAPTGAVLTVDINEAGVSILSTKLTIDATEKTSTTAATAAVISDAALADDAEITIDIDTVGSTVAGAGLKVWLIGYRA